MTETNHPAAPENNLPMSKPPRFGTVEEAAVIVGLPPKETRNLTKKFRAYFVIGKLERVDLTALEAGIEAEFAEKAARATNRKPTGKGNQLGLAKARLVQVDERLLKKQSKIEAAEKALAEAANRWERHQVQQNVAKLRRELDALVEGKARDEALLELLLNGDDSEDDGK